LRRSRAPRLLLAALLVLPVVAAPAPAAALGRQWVRQFGSSGTDVAAGVAADATGVTAVGSIGPQAFVRRYSSTGAYQWARQFTTTAPDPMFTQAMVSANAVAADANGLTIGGTTQGPLSGQPYAGMGDGFVRRYNRSGAILWTRLFGGSQDAETVQGIASDSSGIYVATHNVGGIDTSTLSRYDYSGRQIWRVWLSPGEGVFVRGVSADSGGITVAGTYELPSDGPDAYVARYSRAGVLQWTRTFDLQVTDPDTFNTFGADVAVDASGLTVVGYAQTGTAFVRRYNRSGTTLWTREIQNTAAGVVLADAVVADGTGAIVAGSTTGALGGQTNSGGRDIYARRYDLAGNATWTFQTGTTADDWLSDAALSAGGVTVSGKTSGAFPGSSNHGGFDAYVLKIDSAGPRGAVTINGGAVYTNKTTVSVAVPATDIGGSGVRQVRLTNDLAGPWRTFTYATPIAWDLADPTAGGSASNGTRRVYAQWLDWAGNWSTVRSDTIILDTVDPALSAPATSFSVGWHLDTTLVPVRISWSGSDATSGIHHYELQQSTNGGAWAAVALSSPTSASSIRWLNPRTSYRFRARAVDRAGNDTWKYGATFRVDAHQETSASIAYTGTWLTASQSGAYGGSVKRASHAPASAALSFTGRNVAFVSTRGPDRGIAQVWLDGTNVGTLDLYATTIQTRQLVYQAGFAGSGPHTLEIRVTGTRAASSTGNWVDVDAFAVVRDVP
jgi:hypothetical protein